MRMRPPTTPLAIQIGGFIDVEPTSPIVTSTVETSVAQAVGNHVYFYSDVESDTTLELIKRLRELDGQLHQERFVRGLPEDYPRIPIWLHIQSDGGQVHAAFGLVDQMQLLWSPIRTIIEGYAASAASIISMAGTLRYITPNSHILIHEAQTFFWGKHSQLEDEMKVMNDYQAQLEQFYKKHSGLSLTVIRDMLKRDTWITAQEALEHGMVDDILGGA